MLYSSKVNIWIQGTVIGQSNNNRPPNFRSMSAFGTVIQNLFTEWYVVKAALDFQIQNLMWNDFWAITLWTSILLFYFVM